VLWCVYGYSLAFTEGNAFIGKFDRLFLNGIFDPAKAAFSTAATFSKGVVIPSCLRGIPGDLRRDYLRPDRRRLRRARQVQRRAGLRRAVVHLRLPAMAHMVWFWTGPDAIKDAARLPPKAKPASCSRKARWTSPAAPWCTSTPPWPAWSVPHDRQTRGLRP
jgi:Amt family ammonium transporter